MIWAMRGFFTLSCLFSAYFVGHCVKALSKGFNWSDLLFLLISLWCTVAFFNDARDSWRKSE